MQRAIFLYWATFLGLWIFGISLIWVEFILLGRCPDEKKVWTSRMIWEPTISQLDWKKLAENPSGPGAFTGCIAKKACFISVREGRISTFVLVSLEMRGWIASWTVESLPPSYDVNSCWKYSMNTMRISSSSYTCLLTTFSITENLLTAFLPLVAAWKYLATSLFPEDFFCLVSQQ